MALNYLSALGFGRGGEYLLIHTSDSYPASPRNPEPGEESSSVRKRDRDIKGRKKKVVGGREKG